ncbi:phage tail protein [Chryseobacterium sp. SL1]|uniref:phage tail protein n=1 Tax=Chryseobacterium sp. SL1 TaxID=2995159 RepID=UPI0022762414|nr:hypothetical protein [Chryseobacterium sp. SL1]MCY1663201.1 hypothetical protein [Chryseobacterium sp. SL1]
MEDFDDEFGDLSQFKTITFEEANKGVAENKNAFENTLINKDDSPEFRSKFHDYRNTPLGYSYLTDEPVSIFPSTGIDETGKKGYEYRAEVLPCENGSQVLGSYNTNKREPQSLFLFYEKPNSNKSNFAGDFYAAKMGDYFVSLFKQFPEPLPAKIGGKFFKNITSMEDEAGYLAQLAYTYEGDKINATLVRDALMREYQFYTGDRRFEEIIGDISSIPADAIGWCAKQLEDFKPNEKNYDPASKDYSPLIPVFTGVAVPVNMNKAAEFFEDLGSNPFVQGVETAFSQVWELVIQSASKVKDASIEHLPDSFKKLVTKITGIINSIKTFLSEIKDTVTDLAEKGIEFLKILNAFNCGVINGLVGLVQCILYILEFLLQPATTFSYQQYLERRDLLEKAEDVLDWAHENVSVFLEGVKNLFSSSGGISQDDFQGIFDELKGYWNNASRYTIAFYTGVIAFEFIINILLLIFTEGAGNIIKGATYVEKASSLLWVLTRETFSAVTFGITDLLLGLGKLIFRFAKACAKGFKGFIKFVEELLQGAKNGAKVEDLAEEAHDIDEVILQGKKLRGFIAQDIKNWLRTKYKIGKATLELLEELGLTIIRNIDDRLKGAKALATPEGFIVQYGNDNIFEGTGDAIRLFSKKIENITNSSGKSTAKTYIYELAETQKDFRNAYKQKYVGRKLANLVDEAKALLYFGKEGKQTVKAVNKYVEELINEFSKNERKKFVMVCGMTHKDGENISKTFTAHNFYRKGDIDELGEFSEEFGRYVLDKNGTPSIYQNFLDDMHITLKKRFEYHNKHFKEGLHADRLDADRAGIQASHGEIRALDALLKNVDPLGKQGDEIFKKITGYNRFLAREGVQPPCAHCHFLTTFVTFIEL